MGEIWQVTSFGDQKRVGSVPAGIVEAVADPDGQYFLGVEGYGIYQGGLWTDPISVSPSGEMLLRTCETTVWNERTTPDQEVTARALGANCGEIIEGTSTGVAATESVSHAPITRIQQTNQGVLWVDNLGAAGCIGCDHTPPSAGVMDAITLHLLPFVPGEFAWIDAESTLWAGYE